MREAARAFLDCNMQPRALENVSEGEQELVKDAFVVAKARADQVRLSYARVLTIFGEALKSVGWPKVDAAFDFQPSSQEEAPPAIVEGCRISAQRNASIKRTHDQSKEEGDAAADEGLISEKGGPKVLMDQWGLQNNAMVDGFVTAIGPDAGEIYTSIYFTVRDFLGLGGQNKSSEGSRGRLRGLWCLCVDSVAPTLILVVEVRLMMEDTSRGSSRRKQIAASLMGQSERRSDLLKPCSNVWCLRESLMAFDCDFADLVAAASASSGSSMAEVDCQIRKSL